MEIIDVERFINKNYNVSIDGNRYVMFLTFKHKRWGAEISDYQQPRVLKIMHPKSLDSDSAERAECPCSDCVNHDRCPF